MPKDDFELINECLQGRPEAYAGLVSRYQDRLYQVIYRVLRHPEDTQDVVQDAFLLAYQSLDRFQNRSGFYTWIYRIAINAAISMRRKPRLRTGAQQSDGHLLGANVPDESAGSRPEAALENAEESNQIERALRRLSTSDRALLLMKTVEGQSYETIARALSIPLGTVRSRLHRARMRLRTVLARQVPTNCDPRLI